MKKVVIVACCCIASVLLCSTSFADLTGYLSSKIGVAFVQESDASDDILDSYGYSLKISPDSGFAGSVAFGISLGASPLRFESELSYQSSDIGDIDIEYGGDSISFDADGSIKSLSLLVNTYYDFVNASKLTPYVTAGAGFSKLKVDMDGGSDDDQVFAYQVGAGIGYVITDTVIIDAAYRYFGTSDPNFDGTEFSFKSHNIYAGLRVNF